jgi:predicted transcriptional regulator
MGRTKRAIETLYLDPEKLELLKQLAADTRIPRSVLLREAVDDLLVKHGKGSKTTKRKS